MENTRNFTKVLLVPALLSILYYTTGCKEELIGDDDQTSLPITNPSASQKDWESLSDVRSSASSSKLQDGRILICGGRGNGTIPNSCDIADPKTRKVQKVLTLSTNRYLHHATKLPNGHILLSGGVSSTSAWPGSVNANSLEVIDPADFSTSIVGNFSKDRVGNTTTLLEDGRVLFIGGGYWDNALNKTIYHKSSEIYNSGTGAISDVAAQMSTARVNHFSVLLPDGRVLVGGGVYNDSSLSSAEIYDPVSDQFSPTGSLNAARAFGTSAVELADGRVLIVGGSIYDQTHAVRPIDSVEIFDINGNGGSGSFVTFGNLPIPLYRASVALVDSTHVIVAGGESYSVGQGPYASDRVFLLNISSGSISELAPLKTTRHQNVFEVIEKTLILAGGWITDSVETYNIEIKK